MTRFSDGQLTKIMKLTNIKGVGPVRILHLLETFGDIDNVFEASHSDIIRVRGFTEEMVKEFERLRTSSDENYLKAINECKENKIEIVTIKDEEYPPALKNVPFSPIMLFLWGDMALINTRKIAIVGNREPSRNAADWISKILTGFKENEITVVSGGARGIDTIVHQYSLELGIKTISVLGTGFFNLYPEENKPLFERIKEKGLLISEYSPNFRGSEYSFVQRNRITSGISDALINVASGSVGGAMRQTMTAFKQKVPIFVPDLSLNILPNEGIKEAMLEYRAQQIISADDFLAKFKPFAVHKKQQSITDFAT